MQRLREERKAPHEEYRLAEEYILGGDHLEQMGDAAFLTWLQQMAIPLREWKERDLRVIVAVLPESVEMALKIMFYLHDALHCCPYCVILDAGGQVKRLFRPLSEPGSGQEARRARELLSATEGAALGRLPLAFLIHSIAHSPEYCVPARIPFIRAGRVASRSDGSEKDNENLPHQGSSRFGRCPCFWTESEDLHTYAKLTRYARRSLVRGKRTQ